MGDANTSRFANLAASGIGTVDCTRHMMKHPNSVGELQKGERYVHFILFYFIFKIVFLTGSSATSLFFSSTSQQHYVHLVMSYDIVCQWSVHLWARMLDLPGYVHIDREGKTIVLLIPKFHIPSHVERRHTSFLFNLTRGVEQTDGEATERG